MNRDDIDLVALKGLINLTAAEIRAVKRVLRAPWMRPMAAEQAALLALKHRATQLCVLRAWMRGRQHLPTLSAGSSFAIASLAAERYDLLAEKEVA